MASSSILQAAAVRPGSNPGSSSKRLGKGGGDRRMVLWVAGGMLLLILLLTFFGPSPATNNDQPTMENTETPGIRASYLLLSELGYTATRWAKPATDLKSLDAKTTTLLLIEPKLPLKDRDLLKREIADFLSRGGRVLATGVNGATLLPGGDTASSEHGDLAPPTQAGIGNSPAAAAQNLINFCKTTPEGASELAAAGMVTIENAIRWSAKGPQFHVAERCKTEPVVVFFNYGAGEAVWWASPLPLTNGGLAGEAGPKGNPEQAANLRLVLASVGAANTEATGQQRTVLFDEYLHEWHEGLVDDGKRLPTWFILGQLGLVAVLLMISLGRRSGPVRMPVYLPRTSPVEFAASMGNLYQKAGATGAVIDAAHGRLMTFLTEQCGLAQEVVRGGPHAITASLAGRFGGDYSTLETHLRQVAEQDGTALRPRSALALVQALESDERALREQLQLRPRAAPAQTVPNDRAS